LIGVINVGVSRSTQIYSGKLPVGEYRIVQIGASTESVNGRKDNPLSYMGTFKVEKDKTTDLGRLILTHANSAYRLARLESFNSNKDLITKLGDQYFKAIYTNDDITGWIKPITDAEKKFGNIEGLLPFGMQCFKETQDNRVVSASKIGSVFLFLLQMISKIKKEKATIIRSKDGLALECVTVKEGSDFDFLAYGEMNGLYKHQKGSDALSPIDTGNLPIGIIAYVVGNDQQGGI
jgi:hypothetical protein